jgi:hypothetical protein
MYVERDHLEPDIVETEMSDFWKRSPEKLIIFHASSPPLYFPDIPRRLLIQKDILIQIQRVGCTPWNDEHGLFLGCCARGNTRVTQIFGYQDAQYSFTRVLKASVNR